MVNTPTLLIGLGGTGGRIAFEVWRKVPEAGRRLVGLHVFDTDKNPDSGLGKPEFVPLWDDGMITQTSPPMSVKECFLAHQAGTRVGRWFPFGDTVGQQPMTDGASQVRSVSRLALLDTMVRGDMRGLDRAIERLLEVKPEQGVAAFRVLVVDTLAGGTGSGMFLQIGLYVRKYLESVRGRTNVVIRNVSLLPGLFTNTGSFSDRPQQQQNVLANGYAALKELDALILARNESVPPDAKQMVFPMEMEYLPGTRDAAALETGASPYETVFLFDHVNSNGHSMTTAGNYILQAIDAIHLQLLSPLEGKLNGQANNNVRAIDNTLGRGRFASMGSATLRYPYDDIVRYLALRWASFGLDEQWLVVDRQWRREVEDARRRREVDPSVEVPVRNRRFVEIVDYRSGGDVPQKFFRDIRRSVQSFRKDRSGVEIASENVGNWRVAVGTRIRKVIEAVGNLVPAEGINRDALKNKATVVEEVRTQLQQIDSLRRQATDLVEKTSSAIAHDVLWEDAEAPHVALDSETRGKAAFRLNTWLLAPSDTDSRAIHGLHPVAVRYFLYRAYFDLLASIDSCENDVRALHDQIEVLKGSYDDPKTPVVETAEDEVLALLEKLRWYHGNGKLEDFARAFEREVKASIGCITEWCAKAIENEVLRKVKGAIEGMIGDWESFFDALESKLQKGLLAEIEVEERWNESGNPLELPVLAGREDKRRFWNHVSSSFAHEGVSPEVCGRLYVAQYLRAVERRNASGRVRQTLNSAVGVEEQLFRDHVVAWCGARLKENESLRLDVVTAIRKEWEVGSGAADTPEQWLRARVQQVRLIAAPWLSLLPGAKVERMMFWGLPRCIETQMSGEERKDLFEVDGDNPVIDDEFSPFEIKRFAAVFAVSIADMPGFRTGSGNYWRAYQDLRNKTLNEVDHGMTPHIDKRWDSPAYLREIDDEEQSDALARLRLATLYAVVHDEIELWERDRRLCWRFHENGQARELALSSGELCAANLLGLYEGLATQFRLVGRICDLARSLETEARRKAKQLTEMPWVAGASAILDRLVDLSEEGGVGDGPGRAVIETLVEALADEVLACAFRFHGHDRPVTAIEEAEAALATVLKGAKATKRKTLQESGRNILQTLKSRGKRWRSTLDARQRQRAEQPGAAVRPLVFLG